MDTLSDMGPSEEAEGRRLLATAFETAPVGDGLAGRAAFGGELLAAVRRRARSQRRTRKLVPAGALLAGGGAAALAVTLTTSVAVAPSAFAAVTAAAETTSAQSFQFTATSTSVRSATGARLAPPDQVTGTFDPSSGTGQEKEMAGTGATLDIIFSHGYVYVHDSAPKYADGKPWIAAHILPSSQAGGAGAEVAEAGGGNQPLDPGALLALLKSAGTVAGKGPASGPGWTGTEYAFTVKMSPDSPRLAGTVDVDSQGRVRHMATAYTEPGTPGKPATAVTVTRDITFGDFGVPVSVTTPPADETDRVPGIMVIGLA